MEDRVIKKLAELGVSGEGLSARLRKASALILRGLPSFSQCSVYVWSEEKGLFELGGAAGTKKGLPRAYQKGSGMPGRVALRRGPLVVVVKPGAKSFMGISDPGLEGFRTVLAHPLRAGAGCLGVLYLKALREVSLSEAQRAFVGAAAGQLAMLLEFDRLKRGLLESRHEIEDLRKRLIDAERFSALGDMAAMLAHEIKNPLVSVGGFAARLKKHIRPGSPGFAYIEQMLSEIRRLEKIVAGAMRVTREEYPEFKPEDMNEILKDVLDVFTDDIKAHGIRVVKDFCKGRLPVMADREQMKIAFDNIIANAIQSMEKGGTLGFRTARREAWVEASITDSGGGIDPGIIDHIFNPFFTTKKEGTGLGLTITNSIVMRHGGAVSVDNRVGVGVTFAVKLPFAGKR